MRHTALLSIVAGILLSGALLHPAAASAQNADSLMQYRRSSLYSLLISHPDLKMNDEIVNAFMALQTPDKYNNHDLDIKCVTTDSPQKNLRPDIEEWLEENEIAKGLVSKWFLRDDVTGGFDPSLILERGLYGATAMDVETARQSKRGIDALGDKGYEMISNTFVIVNDITYIDHEKNAQIASGVLALISGIAAISSSEDEDNDAAAIVSGAAAAGSLISSMIAGFTVRIRTYLFQLEWDDETAGKFYDLYYFDSQSGDSSASLRKAAYEKDDSTFRLKYVGQYKARSDKPVLRGLYSPEDVFRKVCARAIDNNVMKLQRKFDQFKVKVPLSGTSPLSAPIGLKEGVRPGSRYEVLVPVLDEATGAVRYNRRGVIRPVAGQIWDNRYMASEEEAEGADLSATTFSVVSGGGFTPGMLIREIK